MTTLTTGADFKDAQVENNLFQMSLAYPAIANKMVMQYTQFSTQAITHALSSMKPTELASNSQQWFVKGRYENPITASGTAPSNTGSNNQPFTFEFTTNDAKKYDVALFKSGVQASFLDNGTQTSGGYTYTMGISGSPSQALVAADYNPNQNVGRGWTTFFEGSEKSYGSTKYPDKNINYTSISRRESAATGSWLTQRVWATAEGGEKVGWYYTKHMEDLQNFAYEREKKAKLSVSNMINGICVRPDLEGNYLPQGDGQLAQMAGYNTDSYGASLPATQLEQFIANFKRKTGLKAGDSVTVETGTQGELIWYQTMEAKYLVNPAVLRQEMKGGTAVVLGNIYPTYYWMGIYFHIVVNPIFDDTQLFVDTDVNGAPKASSNFYFTVSTQATGEPNLVRYVRALEDWDRGNIMKELGGMMSSPGIVGSGRDAKVINFLSDEMYIIADQTRTATLIKQ